MNPFDSLSHPPIDFRTPANSRLGGPFERSSWPVGTALRDTYSKDSKISEYIKGPHCNEVTCLIEVGVLTSR